MAEVIDSVETSYPHKLPLMDNHHYVYLCNLYFLDKIKQGISPEEAIRLAYSNPAFVTQFSAQLWAEVFLAQVAIIETNLYFYMQESILMLMAEKELNDFLTNLAFEYQREKFIDEFNENLLRNENLSALIASEQKAQLKALVERLNALFQDNTKKIQDINARIAVLLTSIEDTTLKIEKRETEVKQLFQRTLSECNFDTSYTFTMTTHDQIEKIMLQRYGVTLNNSFKITDKELEDKIKQVFFEHVAQDPEHAVEACKKAIENMVRDHYAHLYRRVPLELAEKLVAREMASSKVADKLGAILDKFDAKCEAHPDLQMHLCMLAEEKEKLHDLKSEVENLRIIKDVLMNENAEIEKMLLELDKPVLDEKKTIDDIVKHSLVQKSQHVEGLAGSDEELSETSEDDKSHAPRL